MRKPIWGVVCAGLMLPGLVRSADAAASEAELAVAAVRDYDPATLAVSDWEVVLRNRDASPANKDAAAKVWDVIRKMQKNGAAKLKLPVTVIAATPRTIEAAITDDNAAQKHADLRVSLEKPVTKPPKPGERITVTGVISDYKPKPFLFIMRKGEL